MAEVNIKGTLSHQVPRPHGSVLCFHLPISHQQHFFQFICLVSGQTFSEEPVSLASHSQSDPFSSVWQLFSGPDDAHA